LSNTSNGTATVNASGAGAIIVAGSGDADINATGGSTSLTAGTGNMSIGVSGTNNTLSFTDYYLADDLALFMFGNDLQFGESGSQNTININSQNDASNHVDRFELSDGKYLTDSDVNNLIQQISAYAVNNGISLNSLQDVQNNTQIMALVAGSWHS
jgi:hypothetical protein